MKQSSRLSRFISAVFPHRGDGGRETARKLILLVAVIALAAALSIIISYYSESSKSARQSESLAKLHSSAESASVKPSSTASSGTSGGILPELRDFYAKNKDVRGWIKVPGTSIDYPVLQGKDNDKYLTTDINGAYSKTGSIFMDYRDSIKPLSQNIILYGHNMGSAGLNLMFNNLEKYNRYYNPYPGYIDFYKAHPVIEFDTLYKRYKWKIFAVFITAGNSDAAGALYYQDISYPNAKAFDKFIADVDKRSIIYTGVEVKYTDSILTLSTCTYEFKTDGGARLAILARRLRSGESESSPDAAPNSNVLFPDAYYNALGISKN